MFKDRRAAGVQLAEKLAEFPCLYTHRSNHRPKIIIGIAAGGIPVAMPIAYALRLPFSVLCVEPVLEGGKSKRIVGAVSATGHLTLNNNDSHLLMHENSYLGTQVAQLSAKARQNEERWLSNAGLNRLTSFAGWDVVLVTDQVIETSHALAAIRTVREMGAGGVMLATPVVSLRAAAEFYPECDDLVALRAVNDGVDVNCLYESCPPLSDSEIIELLRETSICEQRALHFESGSPTERSTSRLRTPGL